MKIFTKEHKQMINHHQHRKPGVREVDDTMKYEF